jgi:hypothetical protein
MRNPTCSVFLQRLLFATAVPLVLLEPGASPRAGERSAVGDLRIGTRAADCELDRAASLEAHFLAPSTADHRLTTATAATTSPAAIAD